MSLFIANIPLLSKKMPILMASELGALVNPNGFMGKLEVAIDNLMRDYKK